MKGSGANFNAIQIDVSMVMNISKAVSMVMTNFFVNIFLVLMHNRNLTLYIKFHKKWMRNKDLVAVYLYT